MRRNNLNNTLKKELAFLAGDFFLVDLPQNRRFMLHYFRRGIQRQFLFYFFTFQSYRYFEDHTGYICSIRWLKKLKKKYIILEQVYDKLKTEFTDESLELLAELEVGKIKYEYRKFKKILSELF